MATYMLIEINCDHLEDMVASDRVYPDDVGSVLHTICHQPSDAQRVLGVAELYRAIRVVGQTGEPTRAEDIKKYWLWKP